MGRLRTDAIKKGLKSGVARQRAVGRRLQHPSRVLERRARVVWRRAGEQPVRLRRDESGVDESQEEAAARGARKRGSMRAIRSRGGSKGW